MKRILMAGLFVLSVVGTAQAQSVENRVIEGKRAKMTILDGVAGMDGTRLSRNTKYIFGNGMAYEIATGKFHQMPGVDIKAMIDTNNYVASDYSMIDGKKFVFENLNNHPDNEVFCASADLSIVSAVARVKLSSSGNEKMKALIYDGFTGKCLDTLPDVAEDKPSSPSQGWGISADGKVVVGRSAPTGPAFTNLNPAFWDRELDTLYTLAHLRGIDDETGGSGTMQAANHDGSVIVGDLGEQAVVLDYDRESRSLTKVTYIPFFPGNEISYAFAVSDQGHVVGTCQRSGPDVYSRIAFLYRTDRDELFSLRDYLFYFYGLDAESVIPLFSPGSISSDGRIISGYSYDGPVWLPWLIELDSIQVHPMPRDVYASQARGEGAVTVKWTVPLRGDQYVLKSYDIYRDTTKIGSVNVGESLEFVDYSPKAGKHSYSVTAVYEDGEASDKTAPYEMIVVDAGGCLPVQEINSKIIYNRTVELSWGLPTAVITAKAGNAGFEGQQRAGSTFIRHASSQTRNAAKYMADSMLDVAGVWNTGSQQASAAVRVGNYLYVSDFLSNYIVIYNASTGARIESVPVAGLSRIYDMIYHDGTLYCVSNNEYVYEVSISSSNPFELSLSNRWPTEEETLSHIGYVDAGEESVLVTGNYNSLHFYRTDGSGDTVEGAGRFDISGLAISGSAYYNGRLYLANQLRDGDKEGSFLDIYDWESGKKLSSVDLGAYPAVAEIEDGYGTLMAGMTVGTLADGTVVLDGMVQPMVEYNLLVSVEIESAPDVVGYNVYRNDVKLNDQPIKARHYTEKIMEPGNYVYWVEYVSTKCASQSKDYGVTETVTITPIGECEAPVDLAVLESNEQITLTWGEPKIEGSANVDFVGFNIYRNGTMLANESWELKLVDADIEKGEKYVYVVEAFYANSCVASDSIEVTPTFEGTAEAPSLVRVDREKAGEKLWNTTTTWDLPYFEKPMAMGYCGRPVGSVTLDGTSRLYVAIGWDTTTMDLYEDLYLVGMEFVLGAEVKSLSGIVYIDNKMAHSEPMMGRIATREWNQMFFNKTFPMKQKEEIVVGYAVSFDETMASDGVIAYDMGPAKPFYSDLVSPDGNSWYSLKHNNYDVNVCINALVVRKRDLENAAKSSDPVAYIQEKVISTGALSLTPVQKFENAPKTTSESFTLTGFNVYRDEKKLNDALLTVFSFQDLNVAEGDYEYSVGAVYKDGEEVLSEPVYVELNDVANEGSENVSPVSVYPNPVQDVLRIEGSYESLSLLDVTGRTIVSDIRNQEAISFSSYKSGIYFVKFTFQDGSNRIVKVVKK